MVTWIYQKNTLIYEIIYIYTYISLFMQRFIRGVTDLTPQRIFSLHIVSKSIQFLPMFFKTDHDISRDSPLRLNKFRRTSCITLFVRKLKYLLVKYSNSIIADRTVPGVSCLPLWGGGSTYMVHALHTGLVRTLRRSTHAHAHTRTHTRIHSQIYISIHSHTPIHTHTSTHTLCSVYLHT